MLRDISLPDSLAHRETTQQASRLIREADERISRFTRVQRPRIDNFVVCDCPLVDAAMRWIVDERLLCGNAFCEWGSGFGVVTLLAALQDFDAAGIEVEPALVQESEQLAGDLGIQARFAQGSFIPDGGEALIDVENDIDHIETDSPSGYDELGMEIADFDLFFAFPWPGEHRFWAAVFDQFSADGALLLTYQGIESMRLQRHIV